MRERFNDQYARHDRIMREMARKERLVHADVLESRYVFPGFAGYNPVDQQERIAMREILQYFMDVHGVHV